VLLGLNDRGKPEGRTPRNSVALDWCDVPSRPRARIWLQAATNAPEDILYKLQECNPHLPSKDWKVVKVEEHKGDVNQPVLVQSILLEEC